VAAFLREQGFNDGDRIGLLYENSIEYIYLYFAVSRAGLVVVPVDTSVKPEMMNFILRDCEACALIFHSKYRRHLPKILGDDTSIRCIITDKDPKIDSLGPDLVPLESILDNPIYASGEEIPSADPNPDPDKSPPELAAIYYTSGSTGQPKGVMLSHRNLVSNTLATVQYLKLTSEDSVIVILPYYYIYGNSLLLTHVAVGGCQVIDNRFMYPEVILDTMEKEQVTGFSGVPSNFMILLNKTSFASRKFKNLRYFTQAGGAMAPEIVKRLMDAFPEKEIYIMYGQTEASPRVSYCPPEKLKDKIGSIGIPVPGVEIKIMNEDGIEVPDGEPGEITVAGDNVMLGYWNQPEEQKQVLREGRLFTGDLGRKDADGYTYVIGRKKEIIKTGGNRVSAKEVEERILENESVSEAAVFGVEDDILGEAVKAVIVLKEDVKLTKNEIRNFCRQKLADHKIPKFIDFIDVLPKYQSGKVNKLQLTKM
jgi:acyl-CoA synthetase (AMP-forming)/AMP-acid ligase II